MLLLLSTALAVTVTTTTYESDDCTGTVTDTDSITGSGSCDDACQNLCDNCISIEGVPVSTIITCSGGGVKCFDTDALVDTNTGAMRIGDLKKGDMVKDSYGDYSEVVGFLHRGDEASLMNEIRTTIGIMRTSDEHIVETTMGMRQAKDLEIGMSLVGSNGPAEIVDIVEYMASGYIAPLTQSGSIQVDGFNASCYAHIPAWMDSIANALFWPRRYVFTNFGAKDGIDNYATFWSTVAASVPGLKWIHA